MLRMRVAQMLRDSGPVAALLTGGIYPATEDNETVMDRAFYPAAFDEFGVMLPTALVRDGTTFPHGPRGSGGAQAIVDVLLWQGRGRAAIDAALPLIRKALEDNRADTETHFVYRLTYAGEAVGPRDPANGDAETAWSRWQSAVAVK